MARTYLNSPRNSDLLVIYSVDQRVGPGCPNKRDDVMLVQFFLKVAREDAFTGKSPGFIPPKVNPIEPDGMFGPITAAHIKFFQQEINERTVPNRIKVDGVVDPLDGHLTVKGSGPLYTIAALNFEYINRQGRGFHGNIAVDPQFPKELRKSLCI